MVDETILVRIKKLLALSQSPNPNEAAAAAAKAQALLTQHNIAMAEVEAISLRKEGVDQFDWADIIFPSNKSAQWRNTLFGAVVNTTYCKAWYSHTRGEGKWDAIGRYKRSTKRGATVIGRPSDVEVARYLFIFLAREIEREASEHAKDTARPGVRGERNRLKASFLKGMTDVVVQRLYNEWREQRSQEQAYGLMVVREGELNEWMQQNGIRLGGAAKHYYRDADPYSYVAGARAGERLQISRGVSGGEAPQGQLR
jgi:hypothetical protein